MPRAVQWPLAVLTGVHLAIVFAGLVAPYAPDRQDRERAFAPPARIHWFNDQGSFHILPFVYGLRARGDGQYEEDRTVMFPLRFFSEGDSYRIAGLWPARLHLFTVDEPGRIYLLGTDDFGRDQFSRFLWGGQISLLAGPAAAILALGIGCVAGALAGFYGRLTDVVLMGVTEVFLALPWFYLLLGARALLPLDLDSRTAFLLIVSLLGATGWARPARLVRGVVLSARERDFVRAARGFGASDFYLLGRHVLPQARGVLVSQAALLAPRYILAEVTMSFLGLGVSEPAVSWGLMLTSLQHYYAFVSHWWMWLPAVLMIPVFFAYCTLAAAIGGLGAVDLPATIPRNQTF
jgi:peptide/nickel transport system permease protein